MNTLLIHGCFDLETIKSLELLGASAFVFDLRSRSPNLIPFATLKNILPQIKNSHFFLSFENDRPETVLSSVDLVKDLGHAKVIFRDQMPWTYYQQVNLPFYWMFHPESDWREILQLPKLQGIFLPLKWRDQYEMMPELWEAIERRELEVYLHAHHFSEVQDLEFTQGMKLSVDLSSEVETSYRKINQDKIRHYKIWRKLHEGSVS